MFLIVQHNINRDLDLNALIFRLSLNLEKFPFLNFILTIYNFRGKILIFQEVHKKSMIQGNSLLLFLIFQLTLNIFFIYEEFQFLRSILSLLQIKLDFALRKRANFIHSFFIILFKFPYN